MTSNAGDIDVGETALPRRIKAMIQLCEGDFTDTAKDLRRQEYFEANDTIVACIHDRFDQPEHTILRTLESLLMKTCKREDHDEDLGLRQRRGEGRGGEGRGGEGRGGEGRGGEGRGGRG